MCIKAMVLVMALYQMAKGALRILHAWPSITNFSVDSCLLSGITQAVDTASIVLVGDHMYMLHLGCAVHSVDNNEIAFQLMMS